MDSTLLSLKESIFIESAWCAFLGRSCAYSSVIILIYGAVEQDKWVSVDEDRMEEITAHNYTYK